MAETSRIWLEKVGYGWSKSDMAGISRIWLEQIR